jgi:hypothetical protein
MTTAAHALVARSGLAGASAADHLRMLAAGATAGVRLVAASRLDVATAAQHLLAPAVQVDTARRGGWLPSYDDEREPPAHRPARRPARPTTGNTDAGDAGRTKPSASPPEPVAGDLAALTHLLVPPAASGPPLTPTKARRDDSTGDVAGVMRAVGARSAAAERKRRQMMDDDEALALLMLAM